MNAMLQSLRGTFATCRESMVRLANYRCENHVLDRAGCILGEDTEPPRGGGLLVLWAPAERGARTIRMTRGDFTARWTLAAG
jgi:hypothetical protein